MTYKMVFEKTCPHCQDLNLADNKTQPLQQELSNFHILSLKLLRAAPQIPTLYKFVAMLAAWHVGRQCRLVNRTTKHLRSPAG